MKKASRSNNGKDRSASLARGASIHCFRISDGARVTRGHLRSSGTLGGLEGRSRDSGTYRELAKQHLRNKEGNSIESLGGRRYVASTPKGVGGDVGTMRGGPHMGRGAEGERVKSEGDLKAHE